MAKKEASTRMYVARDKTSDEPIALIEATGVSQARSYLSKKNFDVRYAEQADLMAAFKAGIEPEKAKADDEDDEQGD